MGSPTAKIYHHRLPENTPFFKVVSRYFPEFERTYSQKYEDKYGFWRLVIHSSGSTFILNHNSDGLLQYYRVVFQLTFKCLNRRSGRQNYTWRGSAGAVQTVLYCSPESKTDEA